MLPSGNSTHFGGLSQTLLVVSTIAVFCLEASDHDGCDHIARQVLAPVRAIPPEEQLIIRAQALRSIFKHMRRFWETPPSQVSLQL